MQQALEIIIGGLLQGGAFALVALGFALIYRVTGMLNLAQGAFVIIGALLLYTFHQVLMWPLIVSFLASLAITVVIGTLIAQFILEPALRKLPPGGAIMITAGLLTFFEGAILLSWGSQPYQLDPFSGTRPYEFYGLLFPTQAPWDAGATVLLVIGMWYVLQKTSFGMALRACSENHAAAALMGIDVRRMTITSFAAAAGIGAIAGMLVGPIISLQFNGGGVFSNAGFIALSIGGAASFFGPIVGGLGLGLVEQGAAGYISSMFSTTIALVLLIVMLIVRPTGIIAGRIHRREDVRDIPKNLSAVSTRLNPMQKCVLSIVALVVLAAAPPVLNATGGAQLLSSLVIAGIFYIALLGLDVLMGYCGLISLGNAAFMAIGGYIAAICCVDFHLAPIVGVLIALAVSLTCATILSIVTVRLRGLYLALATLAFGLLIDTLTVGLRDWTGGPSGLPRIPSFSLGSFTFATPTANYYLVWSVAVVGLIVLSNAMRSDFGRTLRSIHTDQTAAFALGVDVPRYKLYAFLIGAAFASIAGSLLAFDFHFISPDMVNVEQSFGMLTMLVVGGEGTLVGPVIGVILLTLLPTVFQFLENYKTLVSGVLLVTALLYFPSGLYGGFTSLVRRFMGRRPAVAAFIVAWLGACVISPTVGTAATLPDNDVRAIVTQAVRPVMKQYGIPGMAVGVTAGGHDYVFNYGVASKATNKPVDPSTLFEVGSITKTFTATLVSYAQLTGKLELSDRVSADFPPLRGTAFDRVQLVNLGTHTAGGLPLQLPDNVVTDADAIKYYQRWKAVHPAGTYRLYSNPSIMLLGVVAANRMGAGFHALMQRDLFAPLGLHNTFLDVPADQMSRYAQGYTSAGKPRRMEPGPLAAEAYGIRTTAPDLLHFVDANLNLVKLDGTLSRAIINTHTGYYRAGVMTQDLIWEQVPAPLSLPALLQANADRMALEENAAVKIEPPSRPGNDVIINKTGSTAGFGAYVAFVPQRKTGVVVLANKAYPSAARVAIAYHILKVIDDKL